MNSITSIICLVIINNFKISKQNQFHEDIFLNCFSNEINLGSSHAKADIFQNEFKMNQDWDKSQRTEKVFFWERLMFRIKNTIYNKTLSLF